MLRETVVFFLLLGILATGFVQSMIALDAADTELSDPWSIINILLQVSVARSSLCFRRSLRPSAGQSLTTPRLFPQALLGSPDFDSTAKGFSPPFGLMCVPACFVCDATMRFVDRLLAHPFVATAPKHLLRMVLPYDHHPIEHPHCVVRFVLILSQSCRLPCQTDPFVRVGQVRPTRTSRRTRPISTSRTSRTRRSA